MAVDPTPNNAVSVFIQDARFYTYVLDGGDIRDMSFISTPLRSSPVAAAPVAGAKVVPAKREDLKAGDSVRAYWKSNRKNILYAALVKAVNDDGTYLVHYLDGDIDSSCPLSNIFVVSEQGGGDAEPVESDEPLGTSIAASMPWSPDADAQLLDLFGAVARALAAKRQQPRSRRSEESTDRPVPLSQLSAFSPHLALDTGRLKTLHLLAGVPHSALRARFTAIQLFNQQLVGVLPMIDFAQAALPWSMAHRLAKLSHLVLYDVKSEVWNRLLSQTAAAVHPVSVSVNRLQAAKSADRTDADPDGQRTVFGQLFRQLHFLRPADLRCPRSVRAWHVRYEGEGGTDVGGLFRDSVSNLCTDLLTVPSKVPLFRPCPNSVAKQGDNQDKFLPDPSSTSSLHMSMFAFVGKLMGTAIRGEHVLNLDFPALLWKPLVGQPIELADLKAVDALYFKVLDEMLGADKADIESFDASFTTTSLDGREIPLKPNGSALPVTAENREEFVQLAIQYRLHEFDAQIAAIRKGLGTIVPVQLLSLFTWQELEAMVCGQPEIDLDYLRANTQYGHPFSDSHATIALFWKVLESFSHKERGMFLRFVWGQSRLPNNPADFTMKFKINPELNVRGKLGPDGQLPVSHTCFFTLDLPQYSRFEVMRDKLVYAFTNCPSIDADFLVAANEMTAWAGGGGGRR